MLLNAAFGVADGMELPKSQEQVLLNSVSDFN